MFQATSIQNKSKFKKLRFNDESSLKTFKI
jgi:hypothetical protein